VPTYVPPRRESIFDHLEVARSRWAAAYPAWPEDSITVAFVEDLLREKIINGPEPVQKREVRGKGQRFKPRDYRELLEVIRLKLGSMKHRSGWLFHLWLRGHEYPIEDVRRALVDEVQVTIRTIMKDLAPTGRFTEPFGVKFDRRVRRVAGEDDVISDFMEPLVAKMVRPNGITEITPNIGRMATELAAIGTIDVTALQQALTDFVAALKGSSSVSAESFTTLTSAFRSTPFGHMFDLMMSASVTDMQQMETAMHGAIDDGTGRSKLVDAIREAPESKLQAVRRLWAAIRSGFLETSLSQWLPSCPSHLRPAFQSMRVWAKQQRLTNRNNPKLAPYTFAFYVSQW
jgi:hypothetical protein